MTEFVDNWSILHTLGEGAFGEVKLLVHGGTGDTVAVKIIDLERHKDAVESVKKEICIHRLLVHPHIIRFYGQRKEGLIEYIFLEYASGGELFNKIEPDIGMPASEAQRFFRQLLLAVEYLHAKGIAHRDIKPENLLLDSNGNLKVTDFGMATVFRLRGVERRLDKRCGTLPYLAPEVLIGPYRAQPADLWSCGIVLVAMLAGELPWDAPSDVHNEFKDWIENKYMLLSPWKKLDTMVLSLIKRILNPNPKLRFTLDNICKHRWLVNAISDRDEPDYSPTHRAPKRLCSTENLPISPKVTGHRVPLGLSQPAPQIHDKPAQTIEDMKDRDICFSQPTHFDDLIVCTQMTQLQFTQSHVNKNNFQKLVSRMTRFFVKTDFEKTIQILCKKLEENAYTWSTGSTGILTINTVDSRKMQLVFKANIINMDNKLLLDFRLSKGCGLEFKKRFLQLKQGLRDIILHEDTTSKE